MVLLIILIVLAIMIFTCHYYCTSKTFKTPPGPINVPIIGSLYLLARKTREPYEVMMDLANKYGSIYGMRLGSVYTVVLSDPALIRDTLKRDEFTGRAPLYLTHGIMGGYGKRLIFVFFAQTENTETLAVSIVLSFLIEIGIES